MKSILLLFALLVLLSTTAFAKLQIVSTIPDFAAIAQEVGGDLVEVKSICRGDQDPHYLEPKPSFTLLLNKADLLIEAGRDLEVGWLPVLVLQARNPKIQKGKPGRLDASEGLTLLEIPIGPIDRSLGDVHPYGNPHYWLNPKNGLIIAEHIAQRLIEVDPANQSAYSQNLKNFRNKLESKMIQWNKQTESLIGVKVVTQHKSFSYFADFSGLAVVDYIEPKPGIPPSSRHIASLVDLMADQKIALIITENYYDPKPARELSAKTKAKVLFLPTSVGGEPGIDSYESLFDYLIQKIKGALKESL